MKNNNISKKEKIQKLEQHNENVMAYLQKKVRWVYEAVLCFVVTLTCVLSINHIDTAAGDIDAKAEPYLYAVEIITLGLGLGLVIIYFVYALLAVCHQHFGKKSS